MIKQTLLVITLCSLSQAEGAPRPREATFKEELETLHHNSICAFTAQERRNAEAALRFLTKKVADNEQKAEDHILKTLKEYKLGSKEGIIYPATINSYKKMHAGKAAPTSRIKTRSATRAQREKEAS